MIRKLLPSLVIGCLGPMALRAPASPKGVQIDYRPAQRRAVIKAVARAENCVAHNNPGCIQRRGKTIRYRTLQSGILALEAWFDRRGCMAVREALGHYNPARPDYADVILEMAGVPGDVKLGRCE